jgi:pimeloyl-ACP methyl ester carboxylesterase
VPTISKRSPPQLVESSEAQPAMATCAQTPGILPTVPETHVKPRLSVREKWSAFIGMIFLTRPRLKNVMHFRYLNTLIAFLGLVISSAYALSPSSTITPALPGRMVDLGGYRLHLDCTGRGEPTVILSAGAGAFSTDWALVQPKVAAFTRVCSYDRGGAAWSDLGPKPRTMDQEAFDLHRMLTIAGEHGPYIMVGQSLGGMVARIFTESNPKEVVGIVLVDAYSEDSQLFMNGKLVRVRLDAKERSIPAPRTSSSISDQLRPTELQDIEAFMKQMGAPQIDAPYNRLPEFSKQVRLWALQQAKYWAQDDDYLAEISARMYAEDKSHQHPLGDTPVVVLTRDLYDYPGPDSALLTKEHKEQQTRMAQLSTQGRQVIVPDSGHEIQLYAPDAVVNAIRNVILTATSGTHSTK